MVIPAYAGTKTALEDFSHEGKSPPACACDVVVIEVVLLCKLAHVLSFKASTIGLRHALGTYTRYRIGKYSE